MLILVGDTRSKHNIEILSRLGWGRMFATKRPSPFLGERWGFDNGAFDAWRRGVAFDVPKFERRLEEAQEIGTPEVAVVPDIVAAGAASLDFSWGWFQKMPDGWPLYLAVQDGMTRESVEGVIRAGWAGLFLGGTDKFKKRTAWLWAELAHEYGLKFHYGRAGTLKKLEHAKLIKADSLDSNLPLWTKERFATFIAQYFDNSQARLPAHG